MFHVPEDPSVPEVEHTVSDWFSPPFGIAENVKRLDDWNAGKIPGVKPKKLSLQWVDSQALRFLSDYESILLDHLKMKLRKLTITGAGVELIANGFVFAPDGDQKISEHKVLNKQYNDLLLYYLKEVLDPILMSRIRFWYKECSDDDLTWGNCRRAILHNLKKTSCRSTIVKLACLVRPEGQQLVDWVNSISLLRRKLEVKRVQLTDAVYLDFAREQLSYAEQRLFPTDSKSYENWVLEIRSTNPWTLPKYRARRGLAIPSLPSESRSKTKDRTQKTRSKTTDSSKPTPIPSRSTTTENSLFCRYCRQASHAVEDCPKLLKKEQRKEKKGNRENLNTQGQRAALPEKTSPNPPKRTNPPRAAKSSGEAKRRKGSQQFRVHIASYPNTEYTWVT